MEKHFHSVFYNEQDCLQAILVNPRNKPTNNKLNQRHFRKIHTYFWVFEKRSKNNATN